MGLLSLDTALERYCDKLGLTEYSEEIKKCVNPQGEMIWLSDIPLSINKIEGEYFVDEAGLNLILDKLTPLEFPSHS